LQGSLVLSREWESQEQAFSQVRGSRQCWGGTSPSLQGWGRCLGGPRLPLIQHGGLGTCQLGPRDTGTPCPAAQPWVAAPVPAPWRGDRTGWQCQTTLGVTDRGWHPHPTQPLAVGGACRSQPVPSASDKSLGTSLGGCPIPLHPCELLCLPTDPQEPGMGGGGVVGAHREGC